MAKFELKLPKMGESVAEATVTNWLKSVGEKIEADEAVLEIATDKVDSEVPSEVSGTLTEILFQVNDVVKVGQTIAIIETEGGASTPVPVAEAKTESTSTPAVEEVIKTVEVAQVAVAPADFKSSDKFYSPLVKNIATAVKNNQLSVTEINEELISAHLSTASFPDPELMIRTSGEHRISNFLLYQLAYAELYFTSTHWPDFRKEQYIQAICDYQNRERRFGKTSEQIQTNLTNVDESN